MTNFKGDGTDNNFTGGAEGDTIEGGGGNDTLGGGSGTDTLAGGAGADTLDGGDHGDTLYAFDISPEWRAPYYGNPWNAPLMDRGAEADTLNGGSGGDALFAGFGDTVNGGADYDMLYISFQGASAGVTVNFVTLTSGGTLSIGGGSISGIEGIGWVEGSEFADYIVDTSASDAPTFGFGGDDHLVAGYYSRAAYGGEGNDTLDRTNTGYGFDSFGDGGDDLILGGGGYEALYGGDGADTIRGNSGFDTLWGGAGNDILDGGSYEDTIHGEDGHDTIYGAGDADTIDGGNGHDVIYGDYSPISSGGALTPASNDEVIFGGDGADLIHGDAGNDSIWSGRRNGTGRTGLDDVGSERDEVYGGVGNDTIAVGYGDEADGGTGTNILSLSLSGATAGVSLDVADLLSGAALTIGGGTIRNFQQLSRLTGSEHEDVLRIAAQSSTPHVYGMGGADVILGSSATDYIHGGAGADVIDAGSGDDTIYLDAAGDVAAGEQLIGGVGLDTLVASGDGVLDLSLATVTGIERLQALGTTRLALTANQFANVVSIAGSFNLLTGGTISVAGLATTGAISLYFSDSPTQLDLTGFVSAYAITVTGGEGADGITGTAAPDNLSGGGGDDLLSGGNLADTLAGGTGNDRLDGGSGADSMSGGAGDDLFVVDNTGDQVSELSNQGVDTVESSVSYTIALQVENLILTGTAAINGTGNSGANQLTGNGAANQLNGGLGADTMAGGGGNDIYFVDNAGDVLIELTGGGVDTVQSTVTHVLGSHFEHLTLLGVASIEGGGNETANTITGNIGNNVLRGMEGDDVLSGGDGADTLIGGAGADAMSGGAGGDTLSYADSASAVVVSLVSGTASGGSGEGDSFSLIENVIGSAFGDAIAGNDQINLIEGGAGADVVDGAGGSDVLYIRAADHAIAGDIFYGGGGIDTVVVDAGSGEIDISSVVLHGIERIQVVGSTKAALAPFQLAGLTTLAGAFRFVSGGTVSLNGIIGTSDVAFELSQDDTQLDMTSFAPAGLSVVTGGNGNDVVVGAGSGESISGNGGNDVLRGNAGTDLLYGGDGNDRVDGGTGGDMLGGGAGDDVLVIDNIGDFIMEGPGGGIDTIESSLTYQLFRTEAQNVEGLTLTGAEALSGFGNDLANVLTGNVAANVLSGGNGDDVLIGGLGADALVGGANIDTASYADNWGAVFVNLLTGSGASNAAQGDTYADIENVTGSTFDDYLIGEGGANRLDGGGGDDVLVGAMGADALVGGSGIDTASYEDNYGAVFVNLRSGAGASNAAQGDSYSGIENVTGSIFADYLIGDEAANRLGGNTGDDVLVGGMGGDVLVGGDGIDAVSYEDNYGAVFVNLSTGAGASNAAEGDSYAEIENVTGSMFNDYLIGDTGANRLAGALGNDFLHGAAGADTFVFDTALSAANNLDTIEDFAVGSDRIELSSAIFGLPLGVLAGSAFTMGAVATTIDHRILYDSVTGTLYFDADGSGAGAAVAFAQVTAGLALGAGDLVVA